MCGKKDTQSNVQCSIHSNIKSTRGVTSHNNIQTVTFTETL